MKTIFIKDFYSMSEQQLAECKVHYGRVEVTARVFRHIVGRNAADLAEVELLQHILDEADLDAPFDILLEAEFGRSICDFHGLDDFAIDYFTQTPYEVVKMDFAHVVDLFRRSYLEAQGENSKTSTLNNFVGQS